MGRTCETQTVRYMAMGRTCDTDSETHGQWAGPVRHRHMGSGLCSCTPAGKLTSSKTLDMTCLSRMGMYLERWGTSVGARASRMVSLLATNPCFFSQILVDDS